MTVAKVHHINCATMCPLGGRWLGGGNGRGRMVAHCLVVETARDGLVVVDTGFGTRDCAGETKLPSTVKTVLGATFDPREPAIAQLAGLGYRDSDVRHLVVTHLDLDHAGGLGDFPAARVHLHAREHAAAMTRSSLTERNRYRSAHWAHGPRWEVYSEDGDSWRGLPAIARLRGIDADIGLLPMHGHTRGHSAVIVRANDRWLVHAGDAYFHRNAVEPTAKPVPLGFRLFERTVEIDGAARRGSVAALRQLRASYSDVVLFSAHDPVEYERLAHRSAT